MDTQYLQERSIGKETRTIRRDYTDEELHVIREIFADEALKKQDVEEAKREVVKEYKVQLDELNGKLDALADKLRTRYDESDVECYKVPNYETGMLEFREVRTGELMDERKLRPNERQLTIMRAAAEAA